MMSRVFLQDIIEDLKFEDLPANWNSFDLESFSKSKKLWDYQQSTVKNAIKVLWKYFGDFVSYQEGEGLEVNQEREEKFFKWYKDNGLKENLDIKLDRRKGNIYRLLAEYYPQKDGKIPYKYFINRMCFWMATGSGKTLVIIKLIQILAELIKRKEIPAYDILILTYRDDLLGQFRKLVDEFNYTNGTKIILKELKKYPEVKREPILFGITVFYYRSDNLSDEQKEKIIDFKNYDNNGKWYVFLDEAHKGDKEESKRQHIYSILSRNGFLFNSSATFIDPRDVVTCAFEFNLSSFINSGYGKHISILEQEIRAFRDEEDYSGEEKEKKKEGETQLSLFVNKEIKRYKLLIPTYKLANYPLIKKRELIKFEITQEELAIIKKYAKYISDDRIFLMLYNTDIEKIKILKESLNNAKNYKYGEKNFKNIDLLIQRIFDYFGMVPEEVQEFGRITRRDKTF